MQASTRISYVFHVSMRKNDVTPSNIKDDGKDDITKRRQLASYKFAKWIVAE